MATFLYWTLIGYWVANMIATAYLIGRPRKPISGGEATFGIIIFTLLITSVMIWGNPA